MLGEAILVVDDTPVNLKLTRILLMNEGYQVLTAASAEEALDLLHSHHPRLILADIQLPGIDGLEMTRRIKQNPATRDIKVVALTAFAMKGDEQKAIDAGCDGYITKPIDTRMLGERIREHLKGETRHADSDSEALSAPEMDELRRRFLLEGMETARQMSLDVDGDFDAAAAARSVHQWVGAGGLLGYHHISRLSREVEILLREKPLDAAQVRESVTNLVLAFYTPREARDTPLPEEIVRALSGKVVALAGLSEHETHRLCVALEQVQALPVFFEFNSQPSAARLATLDLAVIHVRPGTGGSVWMDPRGPAAALPVVFVGERDHVVELDPALQAMARQVLMGPWQPGEALVRLTLALTRPAPAKPAALPLRPRVMVIWQDTPVSSQVHIALQDYGIECGHAPNGQSVIDAVRQAQPHVSILGDFGVLADIRRENLSTRVLLLTGHEHESEAIRGFALGADDYLATPFSSLELTARLRRLLAS